ncbi:MAG: DUF4173 domain-containing protein [Bacteroidales bacterium]|nr:DUF4173 domain-containing protein [Bacteroidales bacterium]
MKKLKLVIGLLAGAEIYCYLMWYQTLGINALIFALLLIGAVFGYKKELREDKKLKILAICFFASALGVALNGNIFSETIYYLSLLTFLSFVQLPRLRAICVAGFSFQINFFMGIGHSFKLIKEAIEELFLSGKNGERKRSTLIKTVRITTIIALFTIFLLIFASANPQFGKMCNTILTPIGDFLEQVFKEFKVFDIVQYLFVFYFLSLFFVKFKDNLISKWETLLAENFNRQRKQTDSPHLKLNLKDEYKTAKWSIIVLNGLLLAVNLTDIFSVWLGFVPDTPSQLSTFVHSGTNGLILSVVLSILILLIVFRDNLNLYPNKNQLQKMANVWILQNLFLLLSVGLRNIHYILECGLTYRRIGVFMFLMATMILLYFLYEKIRDKKTIFYYLKQTNWSVMIMLVICSLVNWDFVIGSYNYYHNKTDINYTKYLLSNQANIYVPKNQRDEACDFYINKVQKRQWQSFSWFDYWAVNQLTK